MKFTFRPEVEREFAAAGGLLPPARQIAKDTVTNLDRDRVEGDDLARRYRNDVHAEPTPTGARVWTDDEFAPIVEFGAAGPGDGSGVYPAKAPMRRAAGRAGRFVAR